MNVIQKVFGTHSERELKRIEPLVKRIEELRPSMQQLSDAELKAKKANVKEILRKECFIIKNNISLYINSTAQSRATMFFYL